MRVNPSEKAIRDNQLDEAAKLRIEKTGRIVALVVAFISVFMFIIKILFL